MRRSREEEDYVTWLVDKMNIVSDRNYGMLLRELYRIEFYSIIPYDEDRGADGLELRGSWADEMGYDGPVSFGPPRVLEVLIGIALRIEFQLFGSKYAADWDYKRVFWDLINNLELLEMDGVLTREDYRKIGDTIEGFLGKSVTCDVFPNIYRFCVTPENLRKKNLWDQMHLYIAEKWPSGGFFLY